jgi:hypothetical protein
VDTGIPSPAITDGRGTVIEYWGLIEIRNGIDRPFTPLNSDDGFSG